MKTSRERSCPTGAALRPKERGAALRGPFGRAVACLALLATVPLSGCLRAGHAHDVDPSRAREALKTALDLWKNGGEPRSLATSATPMTVQDFDWASGLRLNDYQVLGDGDPRGANLSIQTVLTLKTKKDKPLRKRAWYLVGTSPAVTVFRDVFRK